MTEDNVTPISGEVETVPARKTITIGGSAAAAWNERKAKAREGVDFTIPLRGAEFHVLNPMPAETLADLISLANKDTDLDRFVDGLANAVQPGERELFRTLLLDVDGDDYFDIQFIFELGNEIIEAVVNRPTSK